MDSQVVYEDGYILAVNKPAGLRVIKDGYNPELPNLASILREQFGNIWVVHRIDRETSGILIFAKTPEAHRELNMQFRKRLVHKEYHALVLGIPKWHEFIANQPLLVNGDRKHRTIVDVKSGKPATTKFGKIASYQDVSLICAEPRTGYTHQIRAHLFAIGYPILNDLLYASKNNLANHSFPISRLALHAYSIQFQHPITLEIIKLICEYPDDFLKAVKVLKT